MNRIARFLIYILKEIRGFFGRVYPKSSFDALLEAIELDLPPVKIVDEDGDLLDGWDVDRRYKKIELNWTSLDNKKKIEMSYLKKNTFEQSLLFINGKEYGDTWNPHGIKVRNCLLQIMRKHREKEKELIHKEMDECVNEIFRKKEKTLLQELEALHQFKGELEDISSKKELLHQKG